MDIMKAAKAWMALFIPLAIGGIGTGISLGFVPDNWQSWSLWIVTLLTGLGTATGVYKVPNVDPKHLSNS